MKKILALLLVLAMCISLFAGCANKTPDATTEPTQTTTGEAEPDLQLEKAIEYLRAFYKKAAEKTPMDYTRLGTVRIGTTSYDVVWSVDVDEEVLKIVKNADGSYTIDINEEAIKESTEPTPYVLTATITGKDGRVLTLTWNHVIPAAIDEEAIDVIKKAYALAPGETLEGTHTLTGVILTVDTMYDPSYMNITVTIEVAGAEDMPIKCYRLKGDGADKLAVGDTITVTGSLTNYNGEIEFAAGCILEAVESGGGEVPVAPENPLDILKDAYSLAPGKSLPYPATLTGTITFVDESYDANYGNITVTMNTHGYTIKCYRMKGEGIDQLNVNDEITVSGVITNYNGTIEFGAGCMLISRVDHEPPAAIPDPTPGTNVSIADAIAIGRGKDHDTYTDGKYYVTGKIVSIENDYYGNLHIADGNGNKLMIYGSYSEDGNTRFGDLATKPAVGDTITVYGAIGRYGSNPQMKNAWIIGAGNGQVTPDVPELPQVTELVAGTPYRFGMTHGNLDNAVYYLAGGMSGYYMATTVNPADAINVYVEETEGGYYFYTMSGENKLYINMVVSGTHVNGTYEATASTVYTYDAEQNTLIAQVEGAPYWFGTRNDGTFTTMGPCKVEYAGFFGQFYAGSEEEPEEPTPEEPDVPVIDQLVADKAYKFGMIQGNLENKVFYLAGGMDGFYMATTEDVNAAIDVYVEETEGGYYFYTLSGETKQYINMVVNDTHVNGAYEAAASTVYTYDSENNTLIAVVNDAEYWFSTRNDNTYTTMGPNKVSYNGFFGQFYDPNATEPDEPDVPDVPEEPTAGLKEGVAYTISAVNGSGTLWFNGTVSSGRFNGSYNESEAVSVYAENVTDGFLLYFMDGTTKQYICMADSTTGGSFSTDAASATVFEWNADKATAAVAEDSNNRGFGVGATSTYNNFSAYDLNGAYNWGQFVAVDGGSTEQPTCEHTNTKVEGAKEATCTENGHTGKTVCTDCGETVSEGSVITAPGHDYENGTCGVCGAADPNYNPDQPEQPTAGLKEGVAYTISADNANGTLWFNGTVSSGRFNGSYNESEAVSVYAENVTDGFLLYFLDGETKQYICMADSTTGGSFSTDAASATVFEWNAEKATAAVAEDSNNRGFGVGATSTYNNFSAYDLVGTYNWGQFIAVDGGSTEQPTCEHTNTYVDGDKEATCTEDGHTGKTVCADCGETVNEGSVITAPGHDYENGTCGVCGEADPNYTPDQPEQPTAGLKEGVAYTISADNANGTLWFNGTVSSGRFNGSYNESEAVSVYAENVTDGFLLYFLDGETKQYICMADSTTGGSFSTDAASATVFEWNADKATAAVAEDSNNRGFGVGATSTYNNFSAYDLSGTYNWGQFVAVDGGSTEQPTCEHTNTTTQGAADATCTEDGHTGKTVCTDCGETVSEGSVITAPGHDYENGTCGVCGEADPNAQPEATSGGKADFNTIVTSNANGDSSYTKTFTTTNGWTTVNCAIQAGGSAVVNPQYPVIGPDNTHKAVCLNGKTSAPGKLTSPTLTGGISKLTMKYTKMFTDTQLSVTITITDLATSTTYTQTVARDVEKDADKYVVWDYEWILETPISGDFTIEVVNNCPSDVDSNKDRMTILELAWEGNASEEPSYEHVIENGGGYAAALSTDGTRLDCYQFSDENVIFYANYFTEKPEQGYYEIREYNGNFYYTSAPSWGIIPFKSITISGQTAQLALYGDEGVIELELTAENQYTVITGTDSIPAGVVFTFGSDSCSVMGHLSSAKCEEDVICRGCDKVICAGLGHEYGEDDVCYRCFAVTRPEEPTAGLQEGVAYTISADNANGTLWFNGTISGGRFNGSYNESEAVSVYAEYVTGGFLLYFLDGETKQYICMGDSTTGGSFSTDAASATVFEWNVEKATAAVAEDSNNRAFGCSSTSTYNNFSAYDLSGTYNWGQFVAKTIAI